MPRLNLLGYVERTGSGFEGNKERKWRDWWLVRSASRYRGIVQLKYIMLPERYVGKRVRIKIELIEENKNERIH